MRLASVGLDCLRENEKDHCAWREDDDATWCEFEGKSGKEKTEGGMLSQNSGNERGARMGKGVESSTELRQRVK